MTEATEQDRIIWRSDLYTLIGVCSETVRQWIKAGKLPNPDVQISTKRMGWRLSTLKAAGIGLV
jgi:predicted DNA-binding transcriptional regulator AlpA